MTPQQIKNSICALFEVQQDGDTFVLSTPINIAGADKVSVYLSPLDNGKWRLDDNGETAFAAAMAGINTQSEQFAAAIDGVGYGAPCNILWDEADEALTLDVEPAEIGIGCLALAHVASRLFLSITSPKKTKERNDFRERILSFIKEIAEKEGIGLEENVPVTNQLLVADCRLETPIPTYIVVAPSALRLSDAELMHSRLQLAGLPGYVVAVVENVKSVGADHFTRATYMTDKAVLWEADMFGSMMMERATHATPTRPQ